MLAIGAPAPTCQRTPAKFSASVMPPAVDGLRFHREPLELSAADAQQLVVLLPADETTEEGGDLDGGRLARRLAGRRPRGTLHLLLMREPLQADPAAISAFSALQKLLNRAKGRKKSTGQARIVPLKVPLQPVRFSVRFSVLYSKNLNNLEPPYGIEP